MFTRRNILGATAGLLAGGACTRWAVADTTGGTGGGGTGNVATHRPPPHERKFVSRAVEETIARVKPMIGDPELRWMFENCFPNTLDTTVFFSLREGRPDSYVITGDIDAMWLRDSSAQVWAYLPLAREDAALRSMIAGVIRRQAECIQIDPYANAFWRDLGSTARLSWAQQDMTEMKPGVAERKWEIDSLCHPVRLAHGYWRATGDTVPFDGSFWSAMRTVVATFHAQQRKTEPGPYHFQRPSESPTESQFLGGYGNPTRKVGLIHSMFRPSDDACLFPFFIPGNLFAVVSLRQLATMASEIAHDAALASSARELADEVYDAARRFGTIRNLQIPDTARPAGPTPQAERVSVRGQSAVWAYEVDGYGTQLFLDDANSPSLLSLAYLGACDPQDPVYRRTRQAAWSERNPYFFKGSAGEGIGSPHSGLRMIWPMSHLIRALSSNSDVEILASLRAIKTTHGGTGFIHESYDQDDPAHFTRSWFAWANSLFGELILQLANNKPALLRDFA